MSQIKDTVERRNQLLRRLQVQQGRAEERSERASELQAKVEKTFGTSEPAELRKIYLERKAAYEASLKKDEEIHDVVEQALAHVEKGESLPVELLNKVQALSVDSQAPGACKGVKQEETRDVAQVGQFDAAIVSDDEGTCGVNSPAEPVTTNYDPLGETMKEAQQGAQRDTSSTISSPNVSAIGDGFGTSI